MEFRALSWCTHLEAMGSTECLPRGLHGVISNFMLQTEAMMQKRKTPFFLSRSRLLGLWLFSGAGRLRRVAG